MKWSGSGSVMSNCLRPHGLFTPWNSPGQNTGLGSLSLLQEIFPNHGLKPGLPYCRRILYQLSHKGSPKKHCERLWIKSLRTCNKGFPGDSVVKNPSSSAGDAGDTGSIPRSGRSLEDETATHSSIAGIIPWTEEPGGLQSMGSQELSDWACIQRHITNKIYETWVDKGGQKNPIKGQVGNS